MTNPTYTRLAATAARLLKKYGGAVTLSQQDAAVYDPSSSTATPGTAVSQTRNAVLLDFGAGMTTVRGNLVQARDRRMYLEPGVAPKLSDSPVIGGVTYSIVSIGTIDPSNGKPVLYDLHVRL